MTTTKKPLVSGKVADEIMSWFDRRVVPCIEYEDDFAVLRADLCVLLGLVRTVKSAEEADALRRSGYSYAIKYPCACPDSKKPLH